jgi:hypothetical protein
MGETKLHNDLNVSGKITVAGIIDSTITGSGKTFANADNSKIFHVSGNNTLTLPAWNTLDTGWTIGIVNVSGDDITVNTSGSNLLNGVSSVINATIYTGFYVYKSDATNEFIAIGTVY